MTFPPSSLRLPRISSVASPGGRCNNCRQSGRWIYLKHSDFTDGHFADGGVVLGLKELLDGDVLTSLAVPASHDKAVTPFAYH